jgi:hypothetical protein
MRTLSVGKLLGLIVCVLALILAGCQRMSKVHTLTDEPDCVTSLEGYYCCKDTWRGVTPALIQKKEKESRRSRNAKGTITYYEIIEGKIISQDEKGVTFSAVGDNPSQDSEAGYYLFDQIETLIDGDGKVVYGVIPKKYSEASTMEWWLELSEYYYSDSKTHKMVLQPNEAFALCLPGGEYNIKAIYFRDNNGNISKGVDYPELTIKVDPGYANYMGHIFMVMEKTEIADSFYVTNRFKIPCKVLSSSESSGLSLFGGLVGGAVGGAVVGAAETASRLSGGPSGDKQVFVGIDKNYQPICKSALKQNIMQIKK